MSGWRGVGEAYDASYASLCSGTAQAISAALGPARSRTLLDIGSGTGVLAALLAKSGWTVTGCEPEPSMREISRTRHPMLRVVDGALPDLPFPSAAFDAVTANFVLNHVPDPRAAAAEMARAVVSGGVLVATIWTASPSWFWSAIVDRAGLPRPSGAPLPAEKDFERTVDGFGGMLSDGGWRTDVSEITWTWQVTPDALWASATGGVASAGTHYLSLNDDDRARFRRAFDELCEQRSSGGLVALEHTAAVAVGGPVPGAPAA